MDSDITINEQEKSFSKFYATELRKKNNRLMIMTEDLTS